MTEERASCGGCARAEKLEAELRRLKNVLIVMHRKLEIESKKHGFTYPVEIEAWFNFVEREPIKEAQQPHD